jgi:hypothetical protein
MLKGGGPVKQLEGELAQQKRAGFYCNLLMVYSQVILESDS